MDASFRVTGVKKGTATITVTTVDQKKTATCKVTVTESTGWRTISGKTYYYTSATAFAKGWKQISGKWYYFDPKTGVLQKGKKTIDGAYYYLDPSTGERRTGEVNVKMTVTLNGKKQECSIPHYYDPSTGKGLDGAWRTISGKDYWYEKGIRQGTYRDAKNVEGYGSPRGREIYDPASDAWYWLDSVYTGAKAENKEVWIPYIYQNEKTKTDGKWVRYDSKGRMIKGWYKNGSKQYYYDPVTGAMAKGTVVIGGKTFKFNKITGVMQ